MTGDPTIRERLRELAEKATTEQVHYRNWSHWVTMVLMGGPARNFVEIASPENVTALLDDLDTLERRAIAAESVLAEIAEGTESDRIGRYDLLRDWVHTKARSLSETRAALEASRGSA